MLENVSHLTSSKMTQLFLYILQARIELVLLGPLLAWQEFEKRSFTVSWATINGKNVGTKASLRSSLPVKPEPSAFKCFPGAAVLSVRGAARCGARESSFWRTPTTMPAGPSARLTCPL